ncbi:hypothetical protein C2S52_001923 [Perilla frutescens var. hirtella]|nr:hypothetical protein C2S52_001923 [Perilla frutescens var. hirtella]
MNNSSVSESTEIGSKVSNSQHRSGLVSSEIKYDETAQDIENQNMQEVGVEVDPPIVIGTSFNQQQHPVQDIENPNLEEYDGAPPNFVQQQHTVQDNDGNQNWEGVAPASPSLILQLLDTIQDDGSHTSEGLTAAPRSLFLQDDESQTSKETRDIELMYRAALEGDWAEAEKLLKQDPTLAYKKRTGYLPNEETEIKFYRPLHVAVALKHDKFALKLIERMKLPKDFVFEIDYVMACSYAATLGKLNIAKAMIKKHPKLLEHYMEALTSAAIFSGKSEVVSYFLEQIHGVDASWLKFLQTAIGAKLYDVALKILEKDGSLATKKNQQGTALHVLARQDISAAGTRKPEMIFRSIFGITLKGRQGQGEMPKDFHKLAEKLLNEIQKLKDKREQLDLLDNPPILHDAAKVGNVDLIRMITRAYPDLIWQTDKNTKRSLFNIAIECREANIFSFLQRFVALDLDCFFTEDEHGNNLLHLAAKSGPRKNAIPALQMQSELAWYKAVEALIPVEFIKKENKEKKKPGDVFVDEHKVLLEESKKWMKGTADSCMLIATIILTVVYAAAFTVPGGNSEATGLPILVKSNWLTCFFIFEALALFSSTLCIITFWSITCSGFVEDQFLYVLPYQLRLGFTALFGSLIGAISAFLSAYHMVLVEGKAWLVKSCLLSIYVILVLAIWGRFSELWNKTKLPECLPEMMSKRNGQDLYNRLKAK